MHMVTIGRRAITGRERPWVSSTRYLSDSEPGIADRTLSFTAECCTGACSPTAHRMRRLTQVSNGSRSIQVVDVSQRGTTCICIDDV